MRTNPTICLDCGQAFVGTTDCPSCHGDPSSRPPEAAPDAEREATAEEEREVIDTPTLLEELEELGFKIR